MMSMSPVTHATKASGCRVRTDTKHRGEGIADVSAKGPAPVEQKAVDGADQKSDRRGGQVPDAEDLQEQGIDEKGEQRVAGADDAELHELREQRQAQQAGGSPEAGGCSLACPGPRFHL